MMHRAKVLDRSNETRLALNAYELALRLDPNHAEANNNLAWMLLTSEDTSLRDPIRALPLAKQAVLIESNAAYLDTLAEAWYQNGDPAQAVELEEKAWSLEQQSAPHENRPPNSFLKKQLEKFRQALHDPSRAPVVAGEASSANGVQTVPQNENKLPAGSPPATTRAPNTSPAAIPPTPTDSPSPPPLPE
jgi:tetratricopeptide (TPR) repeat protein